MKLGISNRLLLAVVGAVAVAVAAMTVGFNVLLERSLSHNANDLVRARVSAQLAALRTSNGRLVLGEAPDEALGDSRLWVFGHGKTLEAPQASGPVSAAARSLGSGPSRFLDLPDADVRLYSAPAEFQGKRLGTVVAAVSLAPYEQTRRTALLGSLAFAAVLLLVVAIAARWVLRAALKPVGRMTEAAGDWSDRQLDRRFELGEPHDELTRLGATLDRLLDRIAASLRREQRFSAELSHELRTPISRILAEAELALRRDRSPAEYRAALEVVRRNAQQVASTIEALVAAAQQEAGLAQATADAGEAAARAVEACEPAAAERGLTLELQPPDRPVQVGVHPDLAAQILQPVLDNACRYGRRRVTMSVSRNGSRVVYLVEDDGPGVAPDEREAIFEPGQRGSAANGHEGAGLGLSLARRLAQAASGEVEAIPGEGGRFVVKLPTA